MLKELLINDTKEQINTLIKNTKDKYLAMLDEDDYEIVTNILNKENYELDDINSLLIDYFSYELLDEELFDLIKNSSFRRKLAKKETLIHIIESYLMEIPKYQAKIISLLNHNININEIELLDKYLEEKEYSNNQKIISIINKLSITNHELLKSTANDLLNIFNIFEKNLINLELINLFSEEKISECKNHYFQYQEIITKLLKQIDRKEIVLLCLTFINDINMFKTISLTKADLIEFIEKIENNGLTLNDNQINRLLDNFRNKYNKDNNKEKNISLLKKKVFEVYDDYFNKNFYFKTSEFINYYNDLYKDDFSCLCFKEEYTPLTRNIFDSFFVFKNVNETTIVLEEELDKYKSFKPSIIDYKIECLENDKVYYERYKFYLQFIDKVKEYYQYKNDYTIEYYIIKNIPSNQKATFYELFRSYYKEEYREIGRNGRSIKQSVLSLKNEYIEELNNTLFDKRYEVLNKYKEYCNRLKCLSIFNEQNLLEIMKEYEDKYYNVTVHSKKKVKNKKK